MRLFALTAAAAVLLASPAAFACSCTPDESGQRAAALLADHNVSIVDATVRGYNDSKGYAALHINKVRVGWLTAQDIRAKYDAQSSCGMQMSLTTMTVAVKAEPDGTYSIPGSCTQYDAKKALTMPQAQTQAPVSDPNAPQVQPSYLNPGAM